MNNICLLAATIFAASSAQAQTNVPLTNGDFEETTQNNFGGFDSAPDIAGWSNYGSVADGGVEQSTAWWGTYDSGRSAFIASGTGAYNTSSHMIQAGDVFTLSFVGKTWGWASQIKATLFFDAPGTPSSPTNVISTFTQDVTGTYATYTFDSIAATAESVGGMLGVIIEKPTGQDVIAFDNVTLSVTAAAVPEPSTYAAVLGALALGAVAVGRRRRA